VLRGVLTIVAPLRVKRLNENTEIFFFLRFKRIAVSKFAVGIFEMRCGRLLNGRRGAVDVFCARTPGNGETSSVVSFLEPGREGARVSILQNQPQWKKIRWRGHSKGRGKRPDNERGRGLRNLTAGSIKGTRWDRASQRG